MNKGALLVARPCSTGSGTHTTQKQVAFWLKFLSQEPTTHAVNCLRYWLLLKLG